MTTITALVLPTEGLPYLTNVNQDAHGTYEFISKTIDGFFDCVYANDGKFHGYVHDEGLLIGLPINAVATALFGRVLAGPCVVFGAYNDQGVRDGNEYSVPTTAVQSVEYLAGAYKMWLEARPVAVN